jgi:molybdenum cofactor cytidylyltransferase
MPRDIRGLLLCGGSSTRFGSDKLLFRHPREGGDPAQAEPLIVHAARNLIAGAGNAFAIIPPGREQLRKVLADTGCEILESVLTARGLGASLAAGVAATADAAGWIVALGDMPFIRAETFAKVRAKLESGAGIAAPVLAATGERGHPVGFARSLLDELTALDGDEGARAVIARHRDAIVLIPVDDPGIVVDIDTRADLARVER